MELLACTAHLGRSSTGEQEWKPRATVRSCEGIYVIDTGSAAEDEQPQLHPSTSGTCSGQPSHTQR